MTLKTLRDLGLYDDQAEIIPFKDSLKQEAIKWVKEMKAPVDSIMSKGINDAVANRFMEFFNITEEDLK